MSMGILISKINPWKTATGTTRWSPEAWRIDGKHTSIEPIPAVEIAAKIEGPKVFAFGGAPTALSYLIELAEQGLVEPDAVIGVPVGFINVEESKEELLQSGLPALVNVGRKGGSTIVVAIINAIIYQLREVVTDDYVRYSTPSSKGGKN